MTELAKAEIWLPPLLQQKYDEGVMEGRRTAECIDLGETSYGACHSAVIVLVAKTRKELQGMVAERNWRRNGDNPGQVYANTCQIIRIFRNDDKQWIGICIASTLRDI